MSAPFSITGISAVIPGCLSKSFLLDAEGNLVKKPGGQLVEGRAQHLRISSMANFAKFLSSLKTNQALCYGVPRGLAPNEQVQLVTKDAAQEGKIARSRDYFDWPVGPGILMNDYDPRPGQSALTREALRHALIEVCPPLASAPTVMTDSASSWISNTEVDDGWLRAEGGLRAYILVADARDIPRAGKALFDRLWLAGCGYCIVSKSGLILNRTIIDAAVFQPERLDFAAGARCVPPLAQDRPDPEVFNNEATPLNTVEAIPDLTSAEQVELKALVAAAREEVAEEARSARGKWAAERLEEYKERLRERGDKLDAEAEEASLKAFRRAVEEQKLPSYFELSLESGERVTVGDLLREPDRYHAQRCRDPLEPDYGNDNRIGFINLHSGGRPHIWSHAHGGQWFELLPQKVVLQFREGDGPLLFQTADTVLARDGDVFEVAGRLARVVGKNGGAVKHITAPWLALRLEDRIRFERYSMSQKAWVPKDCPRDLPGRIIDSQGGWSVKRLSGIIKAPLLREDGSLLSVPGWDRATELLHFSDETVTRGHVPPLPGKDQVRAALATAWEPFAHFPFKTSLDRAVALAAMMTAIQRPMLPTAPGFAFDAPTAGTGKTKAAQAIGMFGGSLPHVSPWPGQKEEQRKTIMAHLLSLPQSLLLDNMDGPVESADLCALLTSSSGYQDRVLGISERVTVPSRVLILMTGNNIQLVGDLSRRVLKITMDHGVERPDALTFPFDPVALMREQWREYRAALLTVLRGFIEAGAPKNGKGSMGSFEAWNDLVRQCVCWVSHEGLAPFELADPADGVNVNYAQDSDTAKLRALLHAWRSRFGDAHIAVKDAIEHVVHGFTPVGEDGESQADAQAMRELLRGVLDEIAGDGRSVNARRLGHWIKKRVGRIVDGLCFERGTVRDGNSRWYVKSSEL
ncbi:hypothetical protein [Fundidesulfovibrio soli]|uniref:hypothetical protein n=1 Tax=Fundidesulfovibrio soli TaxID=2922716 RepID=UPI001FAECCF9|nr:hypothetical protein [Fundidesulfovibrio soli]